MLKTPGPSPGTYFRVHPPSRSHIIEEPEPSKSTSRYARYVKRKSTEDLSAIGKSVNFETGVGTIDVTFSLLETRIKELEDENVHE